MLCPADLEGIAQGLLDEAAFVDEPTDAIELARCCGFEVVFSDVAEAVLLEPAIYVPRRSRLVRVHGEVAHELGHWALRRLGLDDRDDRDADYLAGAIVVPRRWLSPRLRPGWHLDDLRAAHPFASAEMLAHRIVQCRELASAAIYDDGRPRRRIGDPRMRHPRELALVDEALSTARAVRLDHLTGAWPVFDGPWRRVIVLAGQ